MKFFPIPALSALLFVVSVSVVAAQVGRPPAGRMIHPTQIPSPPSVVPATIAPGQVYDDPVLAPAPPRNVPPRPAQEELPSLGTTDALPTSTTPVLLPTSSTPLPGSSKRDTMDACLATLAKLRIEQKDLDATLALIAKMNNPTTKAKTLTDLAEYIAHDPDFKPQAAVLFDEAVKATLGLGNLTPADIPELKPQAKALEEITSRLSDMVPQPAVDITQGQPATPRANEPPIPVTPEPNLDSPLGDLDVTLKPETKEAATPATGAPVLPTTQPAVTPAIPTTTTAPAVPAAVPGTATAPSVPASRPTSRPMPRSGSRPTPRPVTTPETTPATVPATAPGTPPATTVPAPGKPDPLQDLLDENDDEIEAPGSN